MVKVDMDVTIAAAINRLATGKNSQDWEVMQHYLALKIIRARDQSEIVPSQRLSGYTQGLRFLFELYPRALAKIEGIPFKRSTSSGKGLPVNAEAAYVVDPIIDDDDEFSEQE